MEVLYWVMDGRATLDIDDALIEVVCEDYAECLTYLGDFAADSCVVRAKVDDNGVIQKQELLWCMLWGDAPEAEPLTVRPGEIRPKD